MTQEKDKTKFRVGDEVTVFSGHLRGSKGTVAGFKYCSENKLLFVLVDFGCRVEDGHTGGDILPEPTGYWYLRDDLQKVEKEQPAMKPSKVKTERKVVGQRYRTSASGADAGIFPIQDENKVEVSVFNQVMRPDDLRELAEFFTELADVLEGQDDG